MSFTAICVLARSHDGGGSTINGATESGVQQKLSLWTNFMRILLDKYMFYIDMEHALHFERE